MVSCLFPEITDKQLQQRLGLFLVPYIEGFQSRAHPKA